MPIRRATQDDLDAVCALAAEINRQHHQALPQVFSAAGDAEPERAFWAARLADKDGAVLLATDGMRALGFAAVQLQTPNLPFLAPRPIGKLNTLAVTADSQGQGVGSALLDAAESWLRQSGAAEMRLEVMAFNQRAQDFYARRGLTPFSSIMAKPLAAQTGEAS